MRTIIPLCKPLGCTPLEAIRRFQQNLPEYAACKLGYAGRLDPMADGLLLVLAGDANRQQEHYSKLDKSYEVDVLFGIATDSYDLLGFPTVIDLGAQPADIDIQQACRRLTGTIRQPYPPYSSVRVQGKPLFWWARHGRLNEVVIPEAERTVSQFTLTSQRTLDSVSLLAEIETRISQVHGDFRQKEILSRWRLALPAGQHATRLARCAITCSSGTYIRSLVHELGNYLGCGATVFSLTRTAIGPYTSSDAIRL